MPQLAVTASFCTSSDSLVNRRVIASAGASQHLGARWWQPLPVRLAGCRLGGADATSWLSSSLQAPSDGKGPTGIHATLHARASWAMTHGLQSEGYTAQGVCAGAHARERRPHHHVAADEGDVRAREPLQRVARDRVPRRHHLRVRRRARLEAARHLVARAQARVPPRDPHATLRHLRRQAAARPAHGVPAARVQRDRVHACRDAHAARRLPQGRGLRPAGRGQGALRPLAALRAPRLR
jgi:hypothetical protein